MSRYKNYPEFTDTCTHLPLNIRVVRFCALSEGKVSMITVCTNLDPSEFTTEDIKEIYRLRWEEEVGFRTLKGDIDLGTIHSRKKENVFAEIYAKLTLYNLCSRIRNALDQRQKKEKHEHRLNFRFLIRMVREHLFKKRLPRNLDDQIQSRTLPRRPNRADRRKM